MFFVFWDSVVGFSCDDKSPSHHWSGCQLRGASSIWVKCSWMRLVNPRPKNRNRFLFLTQLVAVAGGVLIFGGGSYCV